MPSTISLSRKTAVSIVGSGFGDGSSEGTMKIDDWPVTVTDWKDTLIEGTLEVAPVPAGFDIEKTLRLLVSPSDRPPVAKDVKVKQ